jgi:methionyl-tRNA formyltransferase
MRIVFVGTGEIGVPTLRTLLKSTHDVAAVVTQPDKPVGRDQRIEAPPIKRAIAGTGIPILQPPRIKHESAVAEIDSFSPDVIVVVAYGQILPATILAIPKYACLNLHASLLPRWRGAAPIQAAIAAGDDRTGMTVMYMDQGLDSGDVLAQTEIPILPEDTGGTLHDRLAGLGPDGLSSALQLIEKGQAPRVPQDVTQVTYAPKLNRESGRIQWSEPARVIERKVRAFNPWPGAFTELHMPPGVRRKLKILSTQVVDLTGEPGQILSADDRLIIATGSGAISLVEVQLEGRKRMPASEFVRGNRSALTVVR